MELPKRKTIRAKNFDYNKVGAYFLTICTLDRRCLLSRIVGTGVLDGPYVELTAYGEIADKYIKQLNDFYEHIEIERYVIMPNHIHFLLRIKNVSFENGPSRTPVPTKQNSIVSQFVSTFKRFCNKEYGKNIWQARSYDHIVRDVSDYDAIANYIYENPRNWFYDELYSQL
ncbi:MAG: transposase [Clostridia bacterium]|nr:transposase [Clostridia bacterium]